MLLLSTVTTSIYWSSRLDRSDQLQQSAAIFSHKTRRVAAYVETHNNIASKRAFPTGVPERRHTTLYLFTDAEAVYRKNLITICTILTIITPLKEGVRIIHVN